MWWYSSFRMNQKSIFLLYNTQYNKTFAIIERKQSKCCCFFFARCKEKSAFVGSFGFKVNFDGFLCDNGNFLMGLAEKSILHEWFGSGDAQNGHYHDELLRYHRTFHVNAIHQASDRDHLAPRNFVLIFKNRMKQNGSFETEQLANKIRLNATSVPGACIVRCNHRCWAVFFMRNSNGFFLHLWRKLSINQTLPQSIGHCRRLGCACDHFVIEDMRDVCRCCCCVIVLVSFFLQFIANFGFEQQHFVCAYAQI